jgi:hypothetical protein
LRPVVTVTRSPNTWKRRASIFSSSAR